MQPFLRPAEVSRAFGAREVEVISAIADRLTAARGTRGCSALWSLTGVVLIDATAYGGHAPDLAMLDLFAVLYLSGILAGVQEVSAGVGGGATG